MPPEILELEPGKLVLIGIGLALITITLVGLGYCTAKILSPSPSARSDDGDDQNSAELSAIDAFKSMQDEIERTEAIKHIASRVIHDFNNISFAITGRTPLIKRKTDDPFVLKQLEEMKAALDSPLGIFGPLSEITKHGSVPKSQLAIESELRRLTTMAQSLIPSNIELSLHSEVPEQTTEVRLSPTTIQQAFMNILNNAVEAIGQAPGKIQLTISHPDEETPQRIRVTIDDNGPGIEAELRTKAFTSFYTTKNRTPVDGLGLSITKRILGEHGAGISLTESPLGGLRAEIQLLTITEDESETTGTH